MLTGTAFALKHGVNSGNLSKYENGWVPLPWAIGDRICFREGLSVRWLATGELPKSPHLFFEEKLLSLIPRRALFSEAFRDFLAPRLAAIEKDFRKEFKKSPRRGTRWSVDFQGWFDGTHMRGDLLPLFHYLVDAWFFTLPEEKRFEMLRHLEKSLEDYIHSRSEVLPGVDVESETVKLIGMFFEQERIKEESSSKK